MQSDVSMLSLTAAALYAIVLVACLFAGREARQRHQQNWHARAWIGISLFFALLMVSRLLGLEEMIRADLRDWLQTQGLEGARREIQGPIIAAILALCAGAALFVGYRASRRIAGRRNIAVAVALASCGLMVATIAVRTVSLHALDRFLNGPLKLNWVGDIGATAGVLGAAVCYILIVSGKLARRPKKG